MIAAHLGLPASTKRPAWLGLAAKPRRGNLAELELGICFSVCSGTWNDAVELDGLRRWRILEGDTVRPERYDGGR